MIIMKKLDGTHVLLLFQVEGHHPYTSKLDAFEQFIMRAKYPSLNLTKRINHRISGKVILLLMPSLAKLNSLAELIWIIM